MSVLSQKAKLSLTHINCDILNFRRLTIIPQLKTSRNEEDAKIMRIEYIITARMFGKLDKKEKVPWHSHSFEVSSGTLIAPGIP
jgi:hypothetical protein